MGKTMTYETFKEKLKKLNDTYSQYEKDIADIKQKMKSTKEEMINLENNYILFNFRSSGKTVEEYINGDEKSTLGSFTETEQNKIEDTAAANDDISSVNKTAVNVESNNSNSATRNNNYINFKSEE